MPQIRAINLAAIYMDRSPDQIRICRQYRHHRHDVLQRAPALRRRDRERCPFARCRSRKLCSRDIAWGLPRRLHASLAGADWGRAPRAEWAARRRPSPHRTSIQEAVVQCMGRMQRFAGSCLRRRATNFLCQRAESGAPAMMCAIVCCSRTAQRGRAGRPELLEPPGLLSAGRTRGAAACLGNPKVRLGSRYARSQDACGRAPKTPPS